MKRSDKNELLQNALQGQLGSREGAQFEALMADDPAFRAAYEEECALDQLLDSLPPAPVSTNFTTRVMQEIGNQERPVRPSAPKRLFPWSWRPVAATAAVLTISGFLFYQQQKQDARQELAESLSRFSEVTSTFAAATAANSENPEIQVRPVAMLQDFRAIESLAYIPSEQEQDLDLYLALQK